MGCLAFIQVTRKTVVEDLLMRSWTWGLKLTMKPTVTRNQPKMLGTNPPLTLMRSRLLKGIIKKIPTSDQPSTVPK